MLVYLYNGISIDQEKRRFTHETSWPWSMEVLFCHPNPNEGCNFWHRQSGFLRHFSWNIDERYFSDLDAPIPRHSSNGTVG